MTILRFGTRKSALALAQTRIVMDAVRRSHPEYELEIVPIVTTGDVNMKPFSDVTDKFGIKGLFTQELEQALLDGTIDAAVHSLKDVPAHVDDRLPLLAYFHREDARDALVLREGMNEAELRKIGCSSARRRLQASVLFPQATIEPVRGNVETRLRKLNEGQFDALVLAGAGLIRLGLEGRAARFFAPEQIVPAPGQGILAVQGRAEDASAPWLKALRDDETTACALAERAFSAALNGGCAAPVGAYAALDGDRVKLIGFFADESRGIRQTRTISGPRDDPRAVGERLAELVQKEANGHAGR